MTQDPQPFFRFQYRYTYLRSVHQTASIINITTTAATASMNTIDSVGTAGNIDITQDVSEHSACMCEVPIH